MHRDLLGCRIRCSIIVRSEFQQRFPHTCEVRRGRFSRTVTLPGGLRTDAATATFEHGILKLSFPKAEQIKARQIPVIAPTEGTTTIAPATDAPQTAAGEQPAAG